MKDDHTFSILIVNLIGSWRLRYQLINILITDSGSRRNKKVPFESISFVSLPDEIVFPLERNKFCSLQKEVSFV
jgi:hypothetical protein